MNSDRQRQITSIFHSAIEREGTERRAFLDGACGDDDALRREVESLINSHQNAGSLLDAPAYERGAELLAGEHQADLAGTKLGRYRIVRLLGAGGMGEVYFAEDTQLGRNLALKLLSRRLTEDPTLVARFRQEARAASTLNHPNIVTIYEVGEFEGTHFIATEFVEGVTLREVIARHPLEISVALDIAMQVASALSKAHGAGVVHRDIKPENVMVDAEGHAKVLDFGIAKLTEQSSTAGQEAPTILRVETSPGAVVGTAHYMSPEQARGLGVDSRTDIFSLGVLLYEMLAGRQPFEGETSTDVMAAIIKKEPPPLARYNREVTEALDLVVQKALAKDRDERYQTAKEMQADLRRVGQRLESSASTTEARATVSHAAGAGGTDLDPAARTAEAVEIHTTSSAEYIITEIKRHKRGVVIAVTVFAVIVAGVGVGLYKYWSRRAQSSIFQNAQLNRITTSGKAKDANISPDGKYVVYAEDYDDGTSSVLVKQTATGNTLVIVPPAKVALWGTVFSPDGNFVYYLMNDLSSDITSLYQVPSIGGTSKKIMSDVDSPPAISPDGTRIVFLRENKGIKFELVVAGSDGSGERVIAKREGLEWFGDDGAAWSPDGKTIANVAAVSSSPAGGSIEYSLLGIDAETGKVRELSPKRWKGDAGRVVWLPNGNTLALIASESDTDRNQVWRVALPAGTASRITNDVLSRDSRTLGVTADGLTLVTVTKQFVTRLEALPADGNTSQVVRLTSSEGNREGFYGFAWTPDRRVVFYSEEGGQPDLWIMNADGTGRLRLISDSFWDGDPVISPDGHYIVFSSNRPRGGSVPFLWRMDLDGGNLTQITSGEDTAPDVSRDGSWVIYSSWNPGPKGVTGQGLWKVSIDGGSPVQLTDYNTQLPEYSPDGDWIVCTTFDDQVTPKRWRNAIIAANGGPPVKQFDRPNYNYQYARWTRDGRYLSYIGPPAVPSNIWLQPVAGGEPRQLTDFKTEMIFRHAWSRDGQTLTVARGNRTTDVVLMKEVEQP
jgi:serine/threonine protein kinase/Tol biopolymer transport system component